MIQVFPGGEAAAKGVHEGDIIVRYAGHPVTSIRANLLEITKPGTQPRELVLLRDGKEITLRVAPGPLKVLLKETPIEGLREVEADCGESRRKDIRACGKNRSAQKLKVIPSETATIGGGEDVQAKGRRRQPKITPPNHHPPTKPTPVSPIMTGSVAQVA